MEQAVIAKKTGLVESAVVVIRTDREKQQSLYLLAWANWAGPISLPSVSSDLHPSATMSTTPATLADVPDGPMLLIFMYLPQKSRVSLSQTCRRLRHLALNEGALGHVEHDLSSHASARVALAHRARNLTVKSTAALQTFILGYSWFAQPKVAHQETRTVRGGGQ